MNNRHKNKLKYEITLPRLFRRSLLYQTKEFFNNSTLHGVRYIAEDGRPFGEKFMWFCFTSIGAVAAFIIIVSLWEKFQTNPTITGLDTDFHNQQVIFPTVTVCPTQPYDGKVKEIALKQLSEYDPNSERFEPFLKILTTLSYRTLAIAYEISLNISEEKTLKTKKILRSLVFDVAIDCNKTFEICKYKDELINCCDDFLPIYTENGYCFSFNSRYFDLAEKEERNHNLHDMFETDKKWTVSFLLKVPANIYLHSHSETTGFDFQPQILWDRTHSADLLISMKQTYTTDDAKQLSIVQRKCIFPDEIKLQFYNDEYSFTNCMKECRIKQCLKFCKCIPPFYRPTVSVQYCSIEQLECLAKYTDNITDITACTHCELSCQNTVYDIEKLRKTIITDPSKNEIPLINIEFLTWPIVRYKREVLFGWVDLLVSFGGIAGLFLGFSLLSGVEIIYYFTMRACCMLYKNRDDLYKIEEEKLHCPQKYYNLGFKLLYNKNSLTKNVLNKTSFTVTQNDINYSYKTKKSILNKRFAQQEFNIIASKNFKSLIKVTPYEPHILNREQQNSEDPLYYDYLP